MARQDIKDGRLRSRNFALLFTARSLSLLGSAIAPVALAFGILDMPGGTAATLGLVLGAHTVAQIVLLLLAGALADRMSRKHLMISADVLAGLAQAGTALLFFTGTATLWPLLIFAAAGGGAAALFLPASKAILPQIIDRDSLQPANALLRLSLSLSGVLGAALGGVLVATIGAGWALMADAGSFALSALLLGPLRVAGARPSAESGGMLRDLWYGWREFTSCQWLWAVVVQFAFVNACMNGAIGVLGPLVAKEHLGGASAWAVILAAQSAGLLAGTPLTMAIRPRYPLRVATCATFGYVLPLLLLAGVWPVWLIAVSIFIQGVCKHIFAVLWDTTLQIHVPAGMLSRMSSYDAMGSLVLMPVGYAAAGPAAVAIGAPNALVIGGVLVAVSGGLVLTSESVRRLPRRPA